jgi:uncharacterized protein YecT (DUF1311 family)
MAIGTIGKTIVSIFFLFIAGNLLLPISANAVQQLSPKKAKAICKERLDRRNSGQTIKFMEFSPISEEEHEKWDKLQAGYLPFLGNILEVDYNHDGKKERLASIVFPGSCTSSEIIDLDKYIAKIDSDFIGSSGNYIGFSDEEVEEDKDLRWASWGSDDSFTFVQGEPVVISGSGLISWFGEGWKRPLCSFERAGKIKVRIKENLNKSLCEAVKSGQVKPVLWEDLEITHNILGAEKQHGDIDKASKVFIDINNDGTKDRIAHLSYVSGAGCGYFVQWIVALSQDDKSVPDSPLNQLLEKIHGPIIQFDEPEQWRSVQVFIFDGKPYILGNGPYGIGVYSVWNNTLKQWCSFEIIEQQKIKHFYNPQKRPAVNQALMNKLQAADADLNTTYKEISDKLDEINKKKLRYEQRIWISERDTKCGSHFSSKSMEDWLFNVATNEERAACVLEAIRERLKQLEDRLSESTSNVPGKI